MKEFLILLSILMIAGCASSPRSGGRVVVYEGYSRHFKVTKGDTNIPEGYKEHPEYIKGEKENIMFDYDASRYLEGIKNDLKEIGEKSKNALEKIEAVADAVALGGDYFYIPSIGSVLSFGRSESNFKNLLGYPEFPGFNYQYPQPPIYKDSFTMMTYKHDLLDFAATVVAYIEDGNHFIRNCKNDYEKVRKKGVEFVGYLEELKASAVRLDLLIY